MGIELTYFLIGVLLSALIVLVVILIRCGFKYMLADFKDEILKEIDEILDSK